MVKAVFVAVLASSSIVIGYIRSSSDYVRQHPPHKKAPVSARLKSCVVEVLFCVLCSMTAQAFIELFYQLWLMNAI